MRTLRFFEIIQLLRQTDGILRAVDIAQAMDVSVRTVYRDIASLQALQIPITGEAGLGYVIDKDCDIRAWQLDNEEIAALSLGLRLLSRTGDTALQQAAQRVNQKLRDHAHNYLFASDWGVRPFQDQSLAIIRAAIRDESQMTLVYTDARDQTSTRTIYPLALLYFIETIVLIAWCTWRQDFRHFRTDRIQKITRRKNCHFHGKGDALREQWQQQNQRRFSSVT